MRESARAFTLPRRNPANDFFDGSWRQVAGIDRTGKDIVVTGPQIEIEFSNDHDVAVLRLRAHCRSVFRLPPVKEPQADRFKVPSGNIR